VKSQSENPQSKKKKKKSDGGQGKRETHLAAVVLLQIHNLVPLSADCVQNLTRPHPLDFPADRVIGSSPHTLHKFKNPSKKSGENGQKSGNSWEKSQILGSGVTLGGPELEVKKKGVLAEGTCLGLELELADEVRLVTPDHDMIAQLQHHGPKQDTAGIHVCYTEGEKKKKEFQPKFQNASHAKREEKKTATHAW
jgi:hypothetical protein